MNENILREILDFAEISPSSLRLSQQSEWHLFLPLTFLLLRSIRPRMIVEVGTTTGDSYLSFCQAIETYKLEAQAICVPIGTQNDATYGNSTTLNEFRAFHNSRYSKFSRIETSEYCNQLLQRADRRMDFNFDLTHIIDSTQKSQLRANCSTWLPRLNPCGVALISGCGQVDPNELRFAVCSIGVGHTWRLFQYDHWLAVISTRPLGVVRDLLLSSSEEARTLMDLIVTVGSRILLEHRADRLNAELRETNLQRDAEYNRSLVERETLKGLLKSTEESLHSAQESLRSTEESLHSAQESLRSTEEAEMDAQIRSGEAILRLDEMWVEKEAIRKKLEAITQAETESTDVSTSVDSTLFSDAKELLSTLCLTYTGSALSTSKRGREFWDECGKAIIGSVLSRRTRFRFPNPQKPKVSILVIFRNKVHLSVLCLASLLLETGVDYELIIVDNASSDETRNLLTLVDSAVVIRNDENIGFGAAAMQAASRSSGEYICLLNNDALLPPKSITALIGVFRDRPDTGAAGGKIRLADGRLQEAGCIVWRDGRVRQWGREDDPRRPQYNFRRVVDYCSGAFLMTPRALFHSMGGLSSQYAPAYYEDVDYCMKMWAAKRPVIYEPRAELYHYEGASSGNTVATRQMITANHRKFTATWRAILRQHIVESPKAVFQARFASQALCRRYVYFVGDISRLLSVRRGPIASRLRDLVRDGNAVTCIHNGEDNDTVGNDWPPEVEFRGIKSMQDDELDLYCHSSSAVLIEPDVGQSNELETVLTHDIVPVKICYHK